MLSALKNFKIITKISIILFYICLSYCSAENKPSVYVRVLLIRGQDKVNLKINGEYRIIDFNTKEVILRARNINTRISILDEGTSCDGKTYIQDKIFFEPKNNLFYLNSRLYRGRLLIIRDEHKKLMAINFVLLEDYIKGVLNQEVSKNWPMEALKAQAVVSRTYALYAVRENKLRPFDLTKDIYSQVYGGVFSERFRTNRAVDLTRNQVLGYQKQIFPAYFHATCGGYTENASLLWKIDLLPLKGVRCNYCRGSPHFRWNTILSLDSIAKALSNMLGEVDIKDIVILTRSDSGRVMQLKIITAQNQEVLVWGKDFRNAVGPNIIRSTNFTLKVIKDMVYFEGLGWGHGVGFCQWGGYFMAKRGFRYKDILKYYFPGSEVNAYSTDSL